MPETKFTLPFNLFTAFIITNKTVIEFRAESQNLSGKEFVLLMRSKTNLKYNYRSIRPRCEVTAVAF